MSLPLSITKVKMSKFISPFFEVCMKHLALLVLAILSINGLRAQQDTVTCNSNMNAEFRAMFYNGVSMRNHDKKEAFRLLRQVVSTYPDCGAAWFHLAEMNYQLGMRAISNVKPKHIRTSGYLDKARRQFKRVIKFCPSYEDYSSYFYLGIYYYDLNEYQDAYNYLKKFRENSSSSYQAIRQTRRYLKDIKHYLRIINNPLDYKPEPLTMVNTDANEYLPVISPDGKFLFFTRTGVKAGPMGEKETEMFMYSNFTRTDTGNYFGKAHLMPYPFNENDNQGGGCVTIDNHTFYITVCKRVHNTISSYKNCDIYVAHYGKNGWGQLQPMGPEINQKTSWEAQPSITSDGNTLYFASARKGGYGGSDIYRSVKDSSGNWCKAENLGPVINTPGDDKTPFIHPDNKTLYFASENHYTLGGFDMFMSRQNPDGSWQTPKNLGYPLNTRKDELAYMVSTNGKNVYFASRNLGKNNDWDIYRANLPEPMRPDSVLLLKGSLVNQQGEPIEDASVEMQNITTLKIIKGLVDKHTGDFAVATPVDGDDEFVVTAKKDGYFFDSQYIKPSKDNLEQPAEMDFVMKQVEIGTRIRLRNIYFDTNSARFDKVSKVTLHNLKRFMKLNPTIHIAIQGHTDSIGTRGDNLDLSERRAMAVYSFLQDAGVDTSRLRYKGFGESRPLSTNATRKGRAKNRRTEIVVTVK